jgi:NADH-quinone oxidoreductase subunit N
VLGAAIGAHSYWLALGGMLSAVISAFVYLRIILTMYGEDPDEGTRPLTVPGAARIALFLSVLATIGFGLVPGPVVDAAKTAVKTSPIVAPIKAPPAGNPVSQP